MHLRIQKHLKFRLTCSMILALLSGTASAQWSNTSEANLHGKVKTMKMTHLKIVSEGDSIRVEDPDDADPFWFKGYVDEGYAFDREGKTTEYHAYMTDDADDNKTVNLYDGKGRLSEQRFFADKRKTGRMTYEYDDEDRIVAVTRYDEEDNISDLIFHMRTPHASLPLHRSKNNIWIYTYDSDGRIKEENCIFPNGKTNFRHLFFYDEQGRQSQMITFDGNNNQQSVNSYRYDDNGKINSIRYQSTLKSSVTRFTFDRMGNEIGCRITAVDLQELPGDTFSSLEASLESPSTNPLTIAREKSENARNVTETRSFYYYDDEGNWTERYFYINDEPQYMQKREYTYWK